MTDLTRISEAMMRWPGMRQDGKRVVVPTHCLYPSNSVVTVVVEGGVDAFRVHDDGRAVDEFMSAGTPMFSGAGSIRHIARQQGLDVSEAGVIRSPLVSFDQLPGTIVLVANVSKDVANYMLDRFRPRPRRDLRVVLEEILDHQFPKEWRQEARMPGRSNKPHRFDFAVNLPRGRTLLLDAVAPEASSINAAVVAHLDVRQAERPNVEQRIIYDDDLRWSAQDLNLLSVGARTVPLSSAREALRRLAA